MEQLPSLHRSYWQGFLKLLYLWPFLISCSALEITYSTADWVLLWNMDRYFDLSASQKEYLDREIKKIHVWHRHHELPQYAQFLTQIDEFGKNGLSQVELEIIFASVENFRVHLAKQASPSGAIFLSTVTPSQIGHLQKVLVQDHRRLVSEIGNESEVRLTRRIASTLETLTSWLGELSVDQETHIRQWIQEFPNTTEAWLTHRRRRQAMFVELLSSSHDPRILEQGLYHWLADSKAGARPGYLVASREWREGIKRMALEIDQILTRDQRMHFTRKIQQLIQDIQELVG
jgi:hypothetical protein